MDTARTVVLGTSLTIRDVDGVARQMATVQVGADAARRLERSYSFLRQLAQAGTPVYGLTTGCGPLAANGIPPERRAEFQRNLIRSHAVSLGPPHPTAFVRAAMTVRAQVFAQGHSGVDPATVDLLVGMLNAGVHPIVREVGGVGASGDLVELAQIALALIADGAVAVGSATLAARDALDAAGMTPLAPRLREGLALMNGTSFHTGTAAVILARAQRITAAAQLAAAMILDVLHGNVESLDPALQAARPHAGQRAVAERVARVVAGSRLLRHVGDSADSQDAYTLRCIPQMLGPITDALHAAQAVVEIELNSAIDNPLFLADERRVVHGGNFHGQPVAMALDQLKTAMVELGVVSERRLARVLDATLNRGLPPFLIRNSAGLCSGFMGLQYCATAMAADNAVLAAPTSVRSIPTNANNQDVVSMGMVAARHARQVIDNVERMIAIELLCAAQALDLRGVAQAGTGTQAAHAVIRAHAAPLEEDRPLADDVDTVCRLIDSGALVEAVDGVLV